jgi:hypothetical protein
MPVSCVLTFEMLMEYAKYRKNIPNPLTPTDWLEKYYPNNITYNDITEEAIKILSDDESDDDVSECEFCGEDETDDHECRESVPANAYLNTK